MGYIKEKFSWFLNHTNLGSQESTFQKRYTSGTLKDKYKMFLKGDYPSEGVFSKLFSSVAFMLNPEHTAFEQQQGLVQKATDTKSINRDSTDNGRLTNLGTVTGVSGLSADNTTGSSPNVELTSTNFTTCVLPHQLSNLHNTLNVDGTDVLGTPSIAGGINIIPMVTTLNSPNGRTRKNFLLKAAVKNSLEIDNDGFIQLKNDEVNPVGKVYTSSGWVTGRDLVIDVITAVDFVNSTVTTSQLTFVDGILVENGN